MLTPSQNQVRSMRKTAFSAAYIVLALILLRPSVTDAEVYKWVDSEGNTQYTQSPPPGDVQAKTIKPPPKINPEHATEQLKNRQKLLEQARDGRTQAAEKKSKEEKDSKQALADCAKAKAHLASFQRPRVNKVDNEGNRIRISEEERQLNISKAKKQVEERCKN